MKVPFLSIFLVEETKALRERMVLKSWNKVMAELTYDPRSLDIQFNILCVASFLIKKKKKEEMVQTINLLEFLTRLIPCGVISWKLNTWAIFDHSMILVTRV